MNTVKTLSLSAALLMAGGTLSLAHAGGIVSDVVTQTADINFAATGTASISLTAKTGLTAGSFKKGDVIASGTATATAGTVAVRWTPGTGTVSRADGVVRMIKITGASKQNFIDLGLVGDAQEYADGGNGWVVPTKSNTSTLKLSAVMGQNEVVSPDTYVISMDAVVWGS